MSTPIRPIQPNTAGSPRFGSHTPAMTMQDPVFSVSSRALGASSYFTKTTRPGWLGWVLSTLANHDYKEMAKLPGLGRVVAEPPIGAMVFLLYACTMVGRLSFAKKRADEGDLREMRDILVRDMTTFPLLLFLYKPMIAWMSKWLEKQQGIRLTQGKQIFSYSELDDIYRVLGPDRLKAIVADPRNHEGIRHAIDHAMQNKHLPGHLKASTLRQLRLKMENVLEVASKNKPRAEILKELDEPVKQAYNLIEKLESFRKTHMAHLRKSAAVQSPKDVEKAMKLFKSNIPAFRDIFSNYARGVRVWSNATAFLIVCGLLGIGVPAFNKWFTEREYQQLQAQRSQRPQPFHPAPGTPFAMPMQQPPLYY